MALILDIDVGTNWVDVYSITGISVGTPLEVMVKGLYGVYIMESPNTPTGLSAGKPLTNIGSGYATASVLAGSDKIWLRCRTEIGTKVSVQERV